MTTSRRIKLEVKNPADVSKIDQRFLDQFRGDLAFSRSGDQRTFEFRMKDSVESQIRERAVGQAKDIVHRRIDELGLREASRLDARRGHHHRGARARTKRASATSATSSARRRASSSSCSTTRPTSSAPIAKSATPESLPEGLRFERENVSVGQDETGETKSKASTYAFIKRGDKETSKQTLTPLEGVGRNARHAAGSRARLRARLRDAIRRR